MNRTPEGDRFGYVGEVIDDDWTPEQAPAEPVLPPRHEDQPEFPEPGIYFDMPEEDYHAIHAVSASGLKRFSASSMDYWANSVLNLDYEERQRDWLDFGKATHALVLEGEKAYRERYVLELDQSDFDRLISGDAEVRKAISAFTEMKPVRPSGTRKQELIDQLAALGKEHGREVDLDAGVPDLRKQIATFEEEQPVSPVSRVTEEVDGEQVERTANMQDRIDQLLALDPEVLVWERLMAEFMDRNEGRTIISAKQDRRVRVAAHMIAAHDEIGPLFSKGWPEVSIFWFCSKTGAPMKARLDWWRLNAIVDLKTFSNQQGMPVNKAITRAIANYRYNIQHVVYDEAVEAAKAMVREHGASCIVASTEEQREFALRVAKEAEPPAFIFIFQQSGIAPVTRGVRMPRTASLGVFSVTRSQITELKREWIAKAEQFGVDPWIDHTPITEIDEESIPMWATEIGKDD